MVLDKDRNIDQWNRIENPEINPCTYSQLLYYRGGKNIQWEKEVSSTSVGCKESWTAIYKSMKLENSHHIQKQTQNGLKT